MNRSLIGIGLALLLVACDGGETVDPSTADTGSQPVVTRDAAGNLTSGLGWELLAFTRSGLTYGVAVAENVRDTERMWQSLPFDIPAPSVDYETDVLMVLGHAVSGSCPEIQFQGLVIEPNRAFGEFTFEHGRNGCTDDANPAAYVLAVERSALPDRFLLSLTAEDICRGCDEDAISVDLTNDDPDKSQWWALGRFGIVIRGAAPLDAHVYTMHFGGEVHPLAILARDWPAQPTWVGGGERFPDRVEAFTANCVGGKECIEDLNMIEPTGPACGANINSEPRQDIAIVITFADDGTCVVEVVPGTDGSEFRAPSSEPEG